MRVRDADLDPAASAVRSHREGEEGAAPALPRDEVPHGGLDSRVTVEGQHQERLVSSFDFAERGAEQVVELRNPQRLLLGGKRAIGQ